MHNNRYFSLVIEYMYIYETYIFIYKPMVTKNVLKSLHYFSLAIWIFSWPRSKEPIFYSTLSFLFWFFLHIRIKYNKMIKYFITFLLLFHLDWSHFMLLCWTRHGFKYGWFITSWLNFQIFWHKVLFFWNFLIKWENQFVPKLPKYYGTYMVYDQL